MFPKAVPFVHFWGGTQISYNQEYRGVPAHARPKAAAAAAAAARSISGDGGGGGGGKEECASSASRVDTGRKDGLPASLHADARL